MIFTIVLAHHVHAFGVVDEVQSDGTTAVRAGVLGEVVASGELLATVMALERLVTGVEGTVWLYVRTHTDE